MTERQDKGLGSQIQDLVDNAVETMNFSQLNQTVQNTIDSVFDELNIKGQRTSYRRSSSQRYQGPAGYGQRGPVPGPGQPPPYVRQGYNMPRRTTSNRMNYTGAVPPAMQPRQAAPVLYAKNPPGTFRGPFSTVLGAIMSGSFGIVAAATATWSGISGVEPASAVLSVVFGGLCALSLGLLASGIRTSRRVRRFRQYVRTLNGRTYATVKELAASVNKQDEFVQKDLSTMLQKGFFPKGRMDMDRTCLILDQSTWNQYQASQNAYQERKKEEDQRQQENRKIFSTSGIDDPEFLKTVQEGENYIQQIRKANDAIPGEEISRKLDTLELLLRKIFTVLRQKPDQLPKLRKFMSFYMPTTIKLVQTYEELDSQPIDGSNIVQAKQEIEDTMDTINAAYEKLLDSFFEEAAMDVRTDITVLENMLAREGLTQSPFETQEDPGFGQMAGDFGMMAGQTGSTEN